MFNLTFASSLRFLTALLSFCLLAHPAHAQSSPAAPAKTSPQSHPATKANDQILAKAAKLYYFPAKAGLNSFDCAVHADWRALFVSANNGSTVAADDPRVVLLNSVAIILHARLNGGSTVEWNPPAHPAKPLDKDSIDMLNQMQSGIDQTLEGFMQFWSPFVNGSVIPASSEGLTIEQTGNQTTIHIEENDTKVTELLDSSLVLKHFGLIESGSSIKVDPSFHSTDKGLLPDAFQARIQLSGAPAEKVQEMHVEIEYQTLNGFPIPAKLNVDIAPTKLDFVLDNCAVNPPSK